MTLMIMSWCPGQNAPCDPCRPKLGFGLMGAPTLHFSLIIATSPGSISLSFSVTFTVIGGSPSVPVSGTLKQEQPYSINYVDNVPLPFTPIIVPTDFDYNHIQIHMDWGARPVGPFSQLTQYGGGLAISFDGGISHNTSYGIA